MTIGTFVVRFCCISKCKSCKFATKETRCNSIYNIQIDKRILNAGKISNFCRILCFHSKWGCQGSLEICLWVKSKLYLQKTSYYIYIQFYPQQVVSRMLSVYDLLHGPWNRVTLYYIWRENAFSSGNKVNKCNISKSKQWI